MYAIIETGGKQYRVSEGDVLFIEKLPLDAGDEVKFDRVLLVSGESGVSVGVPAINGAVVEGKVVKQGKAKKIHVFKYNAKKNYRRRQGHRQPYSKVEILRISVN